MHVQYVTLCDQIILANDGRPSLIGIVNDLQVPQLPVTLPRLAFAARLLFTSDEAGRSYHVEIRITDPNGVEIGRPGGDTELPKAPPGADSITVDLPMHLDLFEITAAGRYTFMLHIDGEPKGAAQLSIRHAQAA